MPASIVIASGLFYVLELLSASYFRTNAEFQMRKPPKIVVNRYTYNIYCDDFTGDIDAIISNLADLRDKVKKNFPESTRIWIDRDWSDGEGDYFEFVLYVDELETDAEYEIRLEAAAQAAKEAKQAAKESKKRNDAETLKQFERLQKQYDKLVKKVQKIKSKEAQNESPSN